MLRCRRAEDERAILHSIDGLAESVPGGRQQIYRDLTDATSRDLPEAVLQRQDTNERLEDPGTRSPAPDLLKDLTFSAVGDESQKVIARSRQEHSGGRESQESRGDEQKSPVQERRARDIQRNRSRNRSRSHSRHGNGAGGPESVVHMQCDLQQYEAGSSGDEEGEERTRRGLVERFGEMGALSGDDSGGETLLADSPGGTRGSTVGRPPGKC